VWDSVTEQWVIRNLSSQLASWHAAWLMLRYDENGDRPDGHAWYRDPPVHVELRITPRRTEIALLHMWVREPGGLHGYVTYLERDPRDAGRWAAANALRKLAQDEIEMFTAEQANRRSLGLPT
jgi:hypothetical protein